MKNKNRRAIKQESLRWIGDFAIERERFQSSQKTRKPASSAGLLSVIHKTNSYIREHFVEGGDEVVGVFYHSKLQKNHNLTESMDAFLALMRWLSALAGHGVLVYAETGHEWLAG
jgi:hypothetical protein